MCLHRSDVFIRQFIIIGLYILIPNCKILIDHATIEFAIRSRD